MMSVPQLEAAPSVVVTKVVEPGVSDAGSLVCEHRARAHRHLGLPYHPLLSPNLISSHLTLTIIHLERPH